MSERSCPDVTTIFAILHDDLKEEPHSTDHILKTISEVFYEFGGIDNVGSMSAWSMFVRKELRQKCMDQLNKKFVDTNVV